MLFDGKAIQCSLESNGIVKVTFDIKNFGANVIGKLMMDELPKVVDAIENLSLIHI